MSLSSFLLGSVSTKSKGKAVVDEDLDALFKSSAVHAPSTSITSTTTAPVQLKKDKPKEKKRKVAHEVEEGEASPPKQKRVKLDEPSNTNDTGVGEALKRKKSKQKQNERMDEANNVEDAAAGPMLVDAPSPAPKVKSKKEKKPKKQVLPPTSDDDADLVEHETVHSTIHGNSGDVPQDSDEDGDGDDEGDPTALVHESLLSSSAPGAGAGGSSKNLRKYTPANESKETRDARTVFIGNVSSEAAGSKSLTKQLKRHVLAAIPTARIESIRFRSVAFAAPTSSLPSDALSTPGAKVKAGTSSPAKQVDLSTKLQRQRERASAWRDEQDESTPGASIKKKFQTPAEKKRVAFIKRDFHAEADVANAYVVFAYGPHPPPSSTGSGSSKMYEAHMDPHVAAAEAVRLLDGSVFLGRTLRFDRVGAARSVRSSASVAASTSASASRPEDDMMVTDPKRTLFVGNLDFGSKEEDVRAFFEGVLVRERGVPPFVEDGEFGDGDEDEKDDDREVGSEMEEIDGEDEDEEDDDEEDGDEDSAEEEDQDEDADILDLPTSKHSKPSSSKATSTSLAKAKSKTTKAKTVGWVIRVRIVRDRETQLGKGFAYVQFRDRECVDELLGLTEGTLKFAKRKLRVQRCRTIPGSALPAKVPGATPRGKSSSTPASRSGSSRPPAAVPLPIPKGDPTLGTKLAHLSKDERKAVKSADADRVARRLAKKKQRGAMERPGLGGSGVSGGGAGGGKARVDVFGKGKTAAQGKVRERVRKSKERAAGAGGGRGGRGAARGGGAGGGAKRVRSERSLGRLNTKR